MLDSICKFYDKGEYPTASKLRKITEEKIGFSGSQSSILRLKENGCQIYKMRQRKDIFDGKKIYCSNTNGIS
jgi:hypothetical protein